MKKGKEVGNMTQCEYCLEIDVILVDGVVCEPCDEIHFGNWRKAFVK